MPQEDPRGGDPGSGALAPFRAADLPDRTLRFWQMEARESASSASMSVLRRGRVVILLRGSPEGVRTVIKEWEP